MIYRSAVIAQGDAILVKDLPAEIRSATSTEATVGAGTDTSDSPFDTLRTANAEHVALATARVICQPNMAAIATALRDNAPLAVFSAACHVAPWAIPDRYGSADFIASSPLPPKIEAPGTAPFPPSKPMKGYEMTSWTAGGQNHVAGIVNGIAYHWWQAIGGNPPGQPLWNVEVLPTPAP